MAVDTAPAQALRPAPPAQRARRSRWRRLPVGYGLPALLLIVVFGGYPLVQLMRMALSDVGPTNIIGHWPFVGFDNVRSELGSSVFWQAAKRTAEFTAVLLAADLLIGFFAASVLATTGRASNFVLGLMVFVWAMPPLVSGSVWKFLLDSDGGVNALLQQVGVHPVDWLASPQLAIWSVAGVAAWASIPFATLIIRGGLLSIPREILEAAAIDGAGYWRIQTDIVLPALRPTLGILSILIVLYAFRAFDFIYVMTSGGPGTSTQTLPYLAYQSAFTNFSWSEGAAVAVLSMAVVLILAVPYVLSVRREEAA